MNLLAHRGRALFCPPWQGRQKGTALLVLIWLFASTLHAQDDNGLRVDLAPTSPSVRIGRPLPTVWDVQQLAPQIREGRLRFRLRNDQQELYQFTTDELVLHDTRQRFRFLLPPVFTKPTPELAVDVTWLDRRGSVSELPPQILRVPFTAGDTALMLVGEELQGRARSAEADRRLEALKLENNRVVAQAKDGFSAMWGHHTLQTVVVSSPVTDFPTDPLAYTPYDLVVVSQSAFRPLRRDQLDALASWVCAGGRLLLEPEGQLEEQHARFLNRLCAGDARGLVWQLDERGRLLWPVQEQDTSLLIAADYGRVVFVPKSASDETVAEGLSQQRTMVQWLWQMRPPLREGTTAPVQSVQARIQSRIQNADRPPAWRVANGRITVRPESDNPAIARRLTEQVQRVLAPTGVKLVPLWLVAALLGGLVLAIGPGEWIVLGRWKRRAWTWVTWPLTTLAVTGAMVGFANGYLRSNDEPRVLTIHDLDTQGRIVRTNRFELLYPSRPGNQTTDVKRGVFADQVAASRLTSLNVQGGGFIPNASATSAVSPPPSVAPRAGVPHFTGRLPGPYGVEQTLNQWTPQLNRVLQVPVEPIEGPLDWSQLDVASWLHQATQQRAIPERIVREIRRQLGSQALVAVHRADGDWTVNDDPRWWVDESSYHRARLSQNGTQDNALAQGMTVWGKTLWLLTHRRDLTGTRLVWGPALSHPKLADLPLLEPEGAYEWAVTVVVPQGDDFTIYRRVFGPRVVAMETEQESP